MKSATSRRNRSPGPWFTNTLLFVLGCGLLAFTRQLIVESHRYVIGFSGVAGWSLLLFGLSAIAVLCLPTHRLTLPLILLFGVVFRMVTLFPAPFMSSDIYRYAWDGVVQHAHNSPYRYIPGDPALAFLQHSHSYLFNHINRRTYAHTIYPPIAQVIFYVVTAINTSVTFMKLSMILFEAVTVYALMRILQELNRRREEVVLYLWCPLLIWEIGSSGHVDSCVMAFMMLAILTRIRRKPVATGLFLGAAVLIKFYPLILLPALSQRKDIKMPVALATLVVLSYACYASAGRLVFGFLGGYVQEEGMETGTRYFLLDLVRQLPGLEHLPAGVYLGVAAAMFVALAFWCWRLATGSAADAVTPFWGKTFHLSAETQFLPGVLFLAFGMMLAFSPHYPWYVAWLIPLSVLLPNLPVFSYTLGLFYLSATSLGAGTLQAQYRLNCLLYSGVGLVVLAELAFRIWRHRRSDPPEAVA